jgi:hypothetical protein
MSDRDRLDGEVHLVSRFSPHTYYHYLYLLFDEWWWYGLGVTRVEEEALCPWTHLMTQSGISTKRRDRELP